MKHIKIVVVGDPVRIHGETQGTEKTRLLISYTTNEKCGEPVSEELGDEMCRKIKALDYIECDSDSFYNVKEVFEGAMKVVLHDSTFNDYLEKHKKKKKD